MLPRKVLKRLKTGLGRLGPRGRAMARQEPADRAWREMLRRLDAEEAERRLSAVESALNLRP